MGYDNMKLSHKKNMNSRPHPLSMFDGKYFLTNLAIERINSRDTVHLYFGVSS